MVIVQAYGIIFIRALDSENSNSVVVAECLTLGPSKSVRGLAVGLVLLGFCVFGWGLRYKLSLYAPPHSLSHSMPEAKLLSGKECGEFAAIHVRPAFKTNLPLAFTTLALPFVLPMGFSMGAGSQRSGLAAAPSRRAPQSVPRLTFSIRPPPLLH